MAIFPHACNVNLPSSRFRPSKADAHDHGGQGGEMHIMSITPNPNRWHHSWCSTLAQIAIFSGKSWTPHAQLGASTKCSTWWDWQYACMHCSSWSTAATTVMSCPMCVRDLQTCVHPENPPANNSQTFTPQSFDVFVRSEGKGTTPAWPFVASNPLGVLTAPTTTNIGLSEHTWSHWSIVTRMFVHVEMSCAHLKFSSDLPMNSSRCNPEWRWMLHWNSTVVDDIVTALLRLTTAVMISRHGQIVDVHE